MKNLPKAKIFKMEELIPLKSHYTISKSILENSDSQITLFSLADKTDISKENYVYPSIFLVFKGCISVLENDISSKNIYVSKENQLRGVDSKEDSIYIEISFRKDDILKNIEKGKVINLKEAIDYVDGGVSNLDIVRSDNTKMMLMAFDKGESLTPHAAPGDAMVIALEGKANLLVGEETFEINEGEQLVFPKDVIHNVTAIEKFKMALILAME